MSRTIIDPYLKIQAALAHDSVEGIRQNAGDIAAAATTLGGAGMKIDTSAVQLAAAGDLVEARDRFGALSEAMLTYMTGLHLAPPEGVRQAFCPMVHRPWLQASDRIENPYYGAEMPTCGDFR